MLVVIGNYRAVWDLISASFNGYPLTKFDINTQHKYNGS